MSAKYLLLFILTFFLISCDNKTETENDNHLVTGRFVDSPVLGLSYKCAHEDIFSTNEKGEFTCQVWQEITFSIGELEIGTINVSRRTVTPYTLFPSNEEAAINLARLLQSMDNKSDNNIISLEGVDLSSIPSNLDFTSATFTEDFENATGIVLIDSDEAKTNLDNYIETLDETEERDSNTTTTDSNTTTSDDTNTTTTDSNTTTSDDTNTTTTDSNSTTGSSQSSAFSDSRVEGLSFRCGTQTGVTDANGTFTYIDSCPTIDFFIGKVKLGSIASTFSNEHSVVYPSDLYALDRNETNSSRLTNALQLLQSLDMDDNPFNGITISENTTSILENLTSNIDLSNNINNSIAVETAISDAGKKLLPISYAVAHYEDTLRNDLNLSIRTVPPTPPVYSGGKIFTNKESITVRVYGEVGASVLVFGESTGDTIGEKNFANITLDTYSTSDTLYEFSISLENINYVRSDALFLSIQKDMTLPIIGLNDTINIDDNRLIIFNINATDDLNITYTLEGSDASLFEVDAVSGDVRSKALANYDNKPLYNVDVVALDRAGNRAVKSVSINIIPLNTNKPVITQQKTVDTHTPIFSSDTNATLLVQTDSFIKQQELNVTKGVNFTLDYLVNGTYKLVAINPKDSSIGNILLTFTINVAEIPRPTINLHSSTDSGISNTDNITNSNPIRITGTADVNATVIIKDTNTSLTSVQVDSHGDYSQYIYNLSEGIHNLTTSVTNVLGETTVSDILTVEIDRTGSLSMLLDLNASSDTGSSSTDNYTSDVTPTFITDQNTTLYVVKDINNTVLQTLTASYLSNYIVTLSTLSDGNYKIYTEGVTNDTDIAGNQLSSSYLNFTIDTVALNPVLDLYSYFDSGVSDSDNITNIQRPVIYVEKEYGSNISIFGNGLELSISSYYTNNYFYLNSLVDGNYSITATVVDLAGNTSTSEKALNIVIDTVGADAAVLDLNTSSDTGYSSSDNITNDTTPTIISSKDVNLKVFKNNVIVQEANTTLLTDGNYAVTLDTLFDGDYKIEARLSGTDVDFNNSTDIAGNPLGLSYLTVTIDTNISTPIIDLDVLSDTGASDSDNITNDRTPVIVGSSDSYVKVVLSDSLTVLETINADYRSYEYIDGIYKFNNGSYTTTLAELSDGNHTLSATVTDIAGNSATQILEINIVSKVELQLMDRNSSNIGLLSIDSLIEKLNNLENMYTLSYNDLSTSSWSDAGDDMYDGANQLYIDNALQYIWETSNTTDLNVLDFGNYTFRTNPSSTVLLVENFQGDEFKIAGDTGADGHGLVDYGELNSRNGFKVFYHQIYNAGDPSINHLVITNSSNPTFTASSYSNNDGFVLSNLDNGATVLYILFAGEQGYHYTQEILESLSDVSLTSNATNDTTPTLVTNQIALITIKDDSNNTIESVTTAYTDGNYTATLQTLTDGSYIAEIGAKGTVNYTAMRFTIDTDLSKPTLDLNSSSDHGVSDSDNITNTTTITLEGIAEAHSRIEIQDDVNNTYAETITDSYGNFSVNVDYLVDATYNFRAVNSDAAGNTNVSDILTVQIDTFGDNLVNITLDANITADTTPLVTVDIDGTLIVRDANENIVESVVTSSNTATLSALTDGFYSVETGDTGTDVAGNPLSFNSIKFQIDTMAPVLISPTELATPSYVTNSSLSVYNTATKDASSVIYTLQGTDVGEFSIDANTGVVTLNDILNLTEGKTYSVQVVGTDIAGNSATYDISISPEVLMPTNTAELNIASATSIASSGEYTVVGISSVNSNRGVAYLYKKSTNGYLKQIAKIIAVDGASNDYFGSSVAISGDYIAVGASGDDDEGYNSGSVYIFKRVSDTNVTKIDKITASDGSSTEYFGDTIAMSEDYITVGVFNDSDNGSYSGSAYVFKRVSDNNVTQIKKLTASDAAYNDRFGSSISISGKYIVVGAYGNDDNGSNSGSAYVFKIGTDTNITQVEKLTANDGAENDQFGFSVSISGDYISVGAIYDDNDLGSNAGSAYIFKMLTDNSIIEIAKLVASDGYYHDYLGKSVSIDGEYIVVSSQDYRNNYKGASYLYKIDNEDAITELKKLVAPERVNSDYFSKIVTITDNTISVVSNSAVYSYDIYADKPYIPQISKNISVKESLSNYIYIIPSYTNVDVATVSYSLTGVDADKFSIVDSTIVSNSALDFESPTDSNTNNDYNLSLDLVDTNGRTNSYDLNVSLTDSYYYQNVKVTAGDGDYNDKFGSSIASSGEYMLVGAPYEDANGEYDAGAAYVYKRETDGSRTQLAKLTALDGASYDYFGYSVSVSGDYIAVGAYEDDVNETNIGSVYIFKRDTDTSINQIAKLTASDGYSNDYFGYSVSISGDYIAVGAYGDDDNGSNSGSVYIFNRVSDTNVTEIAKLTASDGAYSDYFGYSVSMDGDYIVTGSQRDNTPLGTNSGSAYIFKRVSDTNVTEIAKLTASDGSSSDYFGYSVSISGNFVAVGAFYDDDMGTNSGSAYIFKRVTDSNITQINKLIASDGASHDDFGQAIFIDGDYIGIGAPSEDAKDYSNSGSVYIFETDPNQP